jgi:phage baseplate assembly protein W
MPIVQPAQQQNCLWPLTRVGRGWKRGTLSERYESALRFLLLTPLGSLVWAPFFGTRVHVYRTQNITEQDRDVMKAELEISIARWIPDIVVTAILVDKAPNSDRMSLTVWWDLPSAQPGAVEAILKNQQTTVEY